MLNNISVMGRLTADPELRKTQGDVPVASFTIACDRDFGERTADFISCTAWRQTGEFISKYFHKGNLIVVNGRLQSRKWQDRDGNNRVNWDIIVEHAYFGSDKPAAKDQTPTFTEESDDDGDLPF